MNKIRLVLVDLEGAIPKSGFKKGAEEMNKRLIMITVFFVLSSGFVTGSQAKSMGQSGLTIYDTTKLIGLTVKSPDGVTLGQIFDLVADSQGHVDFAIVSQPGFEEFPGRLVAVPFNSLRIWEGRSQQTHVVLNADKEKFYEAPNWGDKNLANRQQAASLDRYFGVQPYWTEEETGKVATSPSQNLCAYPYSLLNKNGNSFSGSKLFN